MLGDKSAADFIAGEIVRGARGTARLSSSTIRKAQRPHFQTVQLGSPKEHWEAGSTANGIVGIRVRDLTKRGTSIQNIVLDVGSLGINSAKGKKPTVGVLFEGVRNSTITGRFAQTDQALSVPLRFDQQCANIKILGSAIFSSGHIDLNGMRRSDLDLSDFNAYPEAQAIEGLASLEVPPGATPPQHFDMSTVLAEFATVGGFPPRGYLLNIRMKGAKVSSADDVRLRLYPSNNPGEGFVFQIASMADDQLYMQQVFVGADARGDLTFDAKNVGGGAVTASISVAQVLY